MGSTPTYNLPYPEPEDAPDGPEQIGALAEGTDTATIPRWRAISTVPV